MRLESLAVRHWRGIEALSLEDFSPRLNLIAGPNESGKSRLVQALRFALFESSKGRAQHKKLLASWGGDTEKPEVTVRFRCGDAAWYLKKVFLTSGHATLLRGPEGTLEAEAAEARLAQLLGVAPAGPGERRLEDRGIWALLWVDQGASGVRPTEGSGEAARAVLQDRLTAEIGEVAAGTRGQRVLELARARYQHFYTQKTGAERAPLVDLRGDLSRAQARAQAAREAHAAVATDATALQQAREASRSLDERLQRARTEAEAAAARVQQGTAARQALALSEERLEAARRDLERAREAEQAAVGRRAELQALAVRLAADEQTLATLRGDAAAAESAAQAARTAVTAAERSVTAARERAERARRLQAIATQRQDLAQLQRAHDEATRLQEAVATHRERLAQLPRLQDDTLAALRTARQQLDGAEASLRGAATRLALQAERPLTVDGTPLAAGERLQLLAEDDRSIHVDGVLRLYVQPGGGELAGLRDAVEDARRRWIELTTRHGVADLAAAEDGLQRRRALELELNGLQRELSGRVPDGVEALAARIAALEAQLQEAAADDAAGDGAGDPESALAQQRLCDVALDEARTRRDVAQAHAAETARAVAAGEGGLRMLRAQHTGLAARVAELPAPEHAATAVAEAQRQFEGLAAQRQQAADAFAALGGERLENAALQARQAHDALREAVQENRDRRIRLEARLENAGGTFEVLQDAEADCERLAQTLAAQERQAAAARRLHEVLTQAYDAAQRRLAQPVIDRIAPYLDDVFPGSRVWLDEQLELQGLRGEGAEEPFDQLSGGAREQLSLLVRLGLAEVLAAGAGAESWPLVLDDVLVNTDPERIRRVQRALFDASRQVQILLFTCHGAHFDGLGADRRFELEARSRA